MTDLVVGGGRRHHHSQRNRLRSVAIAVGLGLVSLLVVALMFDRMVSFVEPATEVPDLALEVEGDLRAGEAPRLVYGDSSLSRVGSLAVLRLRGEPAALGTAHGRLLGRQLGQQQAALAPLLDAAVRSAGFFGRMTHSWRLRWHYRELDDGIPGHQLVEMAHLIAAAKAQGGAADDDDAPPDAGALSLPEYEAFVRAQAALDAGAAAPWSSGANFRALTRATSAVAAVRDPGGDRMLVTRSLSLPGAADGGDAAAAAPVVFFVRPPGVIPFASVGWPGLVGVLTGVNAEGIAVFVHPAYAAAEDSVAAAQPAALLARDILENTRTLDEALAVFEHAETLGALSFLLVDGRARRFAVVERSRGRTAVRKGEGGVVTDVFTSDAFADDPENDRARRVRPADMRARRAAALLAKRPSGPEDMLALLRDQRDSGGRPLPLGHRGALRDPSAVHAVLLDVSTMVLWVADGPDPAAQFRAFDLRHELGGGPPAPPPDLPAMSGAGPHESDRVRAARAHLRAARYHAAHDAAALAREQAARALALTPDLPEALLLAGDLARASGDSDAAKRFFGRSLEVGLDDPGAEEEIRALLGTP
ncbi:carcinine hydrolase/isopenicillin-N N-acyltransferase family protein [Haliangium ochraceum]|uniref:Peptidase C45 acyl-coenzyme A:6-aminopenicillanic acid acyl-transferase n=1 Tax=Haliangium ochraceum (strain DSM 14365 / JCM 11303 / SMP-2) TaxID=502025 RepID=D0LW43_HALO1|nr:carcinine hydrolase/isopenicillin-N N-acyltransferase family protein [Haliangium ochraceum]ACY15975.1 peptidase C45 acyl-coenzyme A:6- aminopenicillanic acid acyl-transferase [Haliangium ochraceum DSM 14365]